MDIAKFCGLPLQMNGVLKSVYTVLKPDTSRIVALLVSSNFKTYVLYIRQVSSETIEIEIGDDEPEMKNAW